MAGLTLQRDLLVSLKKETLLNVGILGKLHPMSSDLSRLLKENSLEKPTQNLFYLLAHYLVTIIDPQVNFSWPLYDSQTERKYRNELSLFINDYSSRGLLAVVRASYLVNPGCYKVVLLIFQMSQLAVQCVLQSKMDKDRQKKLYNEMTEKYKTQSDSDFIESIENETEVMLSKFSNYLCKRDALEHIASKMRDRITAMEQNEKRLNPQGYIDNLVDGYIKKYLLDEESKKEILEIKNVKKPAQYFDKWLKYIDEEIDKMESKWDEKMSPFMYLAKDTMEKTETLIARQTGEADKQTFMIEYNPNTDDLNTDELEKEVNSQQKYILKNIIKDGKLNFPNLIRGFMISICFILKDMEIGDEIYQFNEYLNGGCENYSEIVNAMKALLERVMIAEGKLQRPQETFSSPLSIRHNSEIPPLPDLSDIRMNREFHPQLQYDHFTPLHLTKHQFNLRKQKTGSFKPLPKSLLVTPFHHAPKDDFFNSLISCRVSAYDNMNVTQHNMTAMSHTSRPNGTITDSTSGFTKQQISRLLSTKKSSSCKKFKHKPERVNLKIKKGALFNESSVSNDSIAIFRSHSSPNLCENKEKRSLNSLRSRKLSIMKEDSASLLEVSGIVALGRDSRQSTPQGVMSLGNSKIDTASLPSIVVSPFGESSRNEIDFKEIQFKVPEVLPQRKSTESQKEEEKSVTPKNTQTTKKTSSLEKIINRFKKIRASVIPTENREEENEIKTIFEEKDNTVNVDMFTANKNLLPDLLSPSCSIIAPNSNDILFNICFDSDEDKPKKPRESLGTALGVDHTFLDQFDLID